MQKQLIIAIMLTAITAGGVGYYFGKSANDQGASLAGSRNDRGNFANGGRVGGRFAGGAGMVGGKIVAKDENSVTIELRGGIGGTAGGSKIVFLTNSTQIAKSATGSMSDLVPGEQVTVFGSTNADGSVTAESVQIRPDMAGGGRASTTSSNQ